MNQSPVNTWYKSFYDDYMAYIKTAERDAVIAAQIASPGPGTQVTVAFIAAVLEEAGANQRGITLQEHLGNRGPLVTCRAVR